MCSSTLIQALLLWRCLQWRNARLYSVLFDVAPCYWKWLCKIPRAQNSWSYESIVLTNRIAGKRMTIKKIKLWRYESIVLTNRIAGKRMNIKKIKLLTVWMEQPTCTLYGGVARHTKMCASAIPFIPSLNDQNQLSIFIIYLHVYISNKTNIICCNWCNFRFFQSSSRAQGFEIQKNETVICATDRSLY